MMVKSEVCKFRSCTLEWIDMRMMTKCCIMAAPSRTQRLITKTLVCLSVATLGT